MGLFGGSSSSSSNTTNNFDNRVTAGENSQAYDTDGGNLTITDAGITSQAFDFAKTVFGDTLKNQVQVQNAYTKATANSLTVAKDSFANAGNEGKETLNNLIKYGFLALFGFLIFKVIK